MDFQLSYVPLYVWDKETKGQRDKGTKGQRGKGTKGQQDKWIKRQRDKGTKGQRDKLGNECWLHYRFFIEHKSVSPNKGFGTLLYTLTRINQLNPK